MLENKHPPPLKEYQKTCKCKKQKQAYFSQPDFGLRRSLQKLPKLTVFQSSRWVLGKVFNQQRSRLGKTHRLQYCLCERMIVRVATSPCTMWTWTDRVVTCFKRLQSAFWLGATRAIFKGRTIARIYKLPKI